MPKHDVVVVTPPPPLLSVMAAIFVRLRGGRLLHWTMDLNPDEAIAAGWLRPDSFSAHLLNAALQMSLRVSSTIVVLDRFMKDRIIDKGIQVDKIHVIAPWSRDSEISFDLVGRESFREKCGLADKFVVMHSGNHSPLHPIDTVLDCALRLQENPHVAFVFVGGGTEFSKVQAFARTFELKNIHCLPYQPMEQLSNSLSAADLHLVLLGNSFVGIVHPCKIYNILAVGSPFLYIGPTESYMSDLLQDPEIALMGRCIRHGDVERLTEIILQLASDSFAGTLSRPGRPSSLDSFSHKALVPSMIALIDAAGKC